MTFEQRYPAGHYVLVDDKPRILAAVKKIWGDRVTTVLPRQGQFAHAADAASYRPAADLTVERISDLLAYDFTDFIRIEKHCDLKGGHQCSSGDLALFAHGHVLRVLVGALARTACGRRTALPARSGHLVRARLLPRHSRRQDLERSPE